MKNRILLIKLLSISALGILLISDSAYLKGSAVHLLMSLSGLILLAIAIFGRTWAAAFISGKKNISLVTSGPYSITRHPLYFFSLLGFIGAGLSFSSLFAVIIFIFIFLLTHYQTIIKEENQLCIIFGSDYDTYKKKVPCLTPNYKLLSNPNNLVFSPKKFTKSVFESSLIIIVYPVAQLIDWLHVNSYLPVVFRVY